MRFIYSLLLVLGCLAAQAAHVTFSLADFTTGPVTNRTFFLTPLSTPRSNSAAILTSDGIPYTTDGTNGTLTVSNVAYGNYLVKTKGQTITQFYILVPNTNATLNANTLLVASNSVPSDGVSYNQSVANGRFEYKATNTPGLVGWLFGTDGLGNYWVAPDGSQFAVTNGRLTLVNFVQTTNRQSYYSNTVREPYWGLSGSTTAISGTGSSRQLLKDGIGKQLLEIRHNDLGPNNDVMYLGSISDWDAISLQINGSLGPVGGANPRITFVMGDDALTWRWRETNMNDAADNNLIGHNNAGSVWLGSGPYSTWIPGDTFTKSLRATNNFQLGDWKWITNGPGHFLILTNTDNTFGKKFWTIDANTSRVTNVFDQYNLGNIDNQGTFTNQNNFDVAGIFTAWFRALFRDWQTNYTGVAFTNNSALSFVGGNSGLGVYNNGLLQNIPLSFAVPTLAKTGNYTVKTNESFTYFNNIGSAAPVTNTLPSTFPGSRYTLVVDPAQFLAARVVLPSTDTIRYGAATGTNIFANTAGAVVTLVCYATNKWVVESVSTNNTWTVQ